ncbi:MAG: response regulator transcription factor [Bacteroidales bacterium]|nr:response regulator transcription factor [Bacteroidales bacterium]
MTVLIIEDEKIAANNLEKLLKQISPDIQILDKLETIRNSVNWLSNYKADLIFLDIHLADGLSFKIFEQIEIKTPVIFTTAYDQYAIKAFKVNSIDYLLKPIDIDDLIQSINKYKDLTETKSSGTIDFKKLIEAIDKKGEYKKRFTISVGRKIKVINANDIAYFYVLEKSIFVHTYDNKSTAIDYSLDKLESLLDPEIFFRINRKYLININSIRNIYTLSKSRIKIELNPPANEDLIISFKRSGMFKKWLNQ